jgi:hypothetical protein
MITLAVSMGRGALEHYFSSGKLMLRGVATGSACRTHAVARRPATTIFEPVGPAHLQHEGDSSQFTSPPLPSTLIHLEPAGRPVERPTQLLTLPITNR